jgi:ribosomal protein S18 acetylase RimI-like enzyme
VEFRPGESKYPSPVTIMMYIRQLGSGDEQAVLGAEHLFDGPADPTAVRSYLEDGRNIFLLAFEKNEPIGFLRGTELGQLKSERKQMFLYEIAVKDGFRRRGVGSDLIKSLLQYCRQRGFEEVFVFTDPANVAAVQLYRSTGAVTETVADRMFVYQLDRSSGLPA